LWTYYHTGGDEMKRMWMTGLAVLLTGSLLLSGCTPNSDDKRNPRDTGSGGGRGGGGTGGMGGGTTSGG
jgi:hypothetical protein